MFGNNVKYIPGDIFSNYTIIIDQRELHEDSFSHLYRDILSGPNSTLNGFISIKPYYRETVTEVPALELIHNATEKYNNMVAVK